MKQGHTQGMGHAVGSTHVSSWTIKALWVGENDTEWLFRTENEACPLEFVSLRKSVVSVQPTHLYFTLVILPSTLDGEDARGDQVTCESVPVRILRDARERP